MTSPPGQRPAGRASCDHRPNVPVAESDTFSLTKDRVFGEYLSAKRDLSRLWPACDPPLKAGFVCLGSRLLANHLEHSAPTRARSQFGYGSSRQGAKPIGL